MVGLIRSLISDQKYSIMCPDLKTPGQKCETEWDFAYCAKVGLLTTEEQNEFEIGLSANRFTHQLQAQQCPKCETYLLKDHTYFGNKMICPVKTCNKAFCWQCLHDWMADGVDNFNFCGNLECGIESANFLLKTCKTKDMPDYGVKGVPIYRSCPRCQTIIEHISGCQHMICSSPACKQVNYMFCHCCLAGVPSDKKMDHMRIRCKPAPRQVLIK
ncbi:hypothetical protein FGO68_gene10042 [Halteria grandinella]|uniref:RBR-type E3 ubiquitin transferase n=1 Tax=Halteria grandinella TaxID=5974 RepID=A0A8J8NPY9_HALGN|nr:hypothetical protein FGO68_gene10042 [Halteria grandinella]